MHSSEGARALELTSIRFYTVHTMLFGSLILPSNLFMNPFSLNYREKIDNCRLYLIESSPNKIFMWKG